MGATQCALSVGSDSASLPSVIWVLVGPTYFHLSREDNDKRVARDQYQLCIQKAWAAKGRVERCNKDLRYGLAIAHWSSWAQLAFIPLVLAWFVGWCLFFLARRVKSRPREDSGNYPQDANAENNDSAENHFPAPWTVEPIEDGFKVVDANGQTLAYAYGHADKRDAETAKGLTLDEARRVASNIAKLPMLLGKSLCLPKTSSAGFAVEKRIGS
jgi:hypothetical protein